MLVCCNFRDPIVHRLDLIHGFSKIAKSMLMYHDGIEIYPIFHW